MYVAAVKPTRILRNDAENDQADHLGEGGQLQGRCRHRYRESCSPFLHLNNIMEVNTISTYL